MEHSSYTDAINDALERMQGMGFEFGPGFVNHTPMASEVIATGGYFDLVAPWVEQNRLRHRYIDPPPRVAPISLSNEQGWHPALGDFRRVLDWVDAFERELHESPWQHVLVKWWPTLLPGMFGMLTHGYIRSAHAVRSIDSSPSPSPLQLSELAHGLGYWAARYAVIPTPSRESERLLAPVQADVSTSLSILTATTAGLYAARRPRPAIPLVHSITAPSALRLFLPHLPSELHIPALRAVRMAAAAMWDSFPSFGPGDHVVAADTLPPSVDQAIVESIDNGDEHAIKLADACRREHAINPNERYLDAANTLLWQLRHGGP